jgi:hypothetical protein
MPFTVDNNFEEGNNLVKFKKAANPYANAGNAEVLRIDDDRPEIAASFVVTSATDVTATLAAPSTGYNHRYFKVAVTDQSGNTATNVGTGTVATVVVDTLSAGLNVNDKWLIQVSASVTLQPELDGDNQRDLQFEVALPSTDPTVVINTLTEGAQIMAITKADGTTVVADGGTYALGAFAAGGTTEAFSIGLKNAGQTVLRIASATPAGDVLSIALGAYDKVVLPSKVFLIAGTIDASGGAGAYSGTVTVVSDDPANPSYAITVSYTLA